MQKQWRRSNTCQLFSCKYYHVQHSACCTCSHRHACQQQSCSPQIFGWSISEQISGKSLQAADDQSTDGLLFFLQAPTPQLQHGVLRTNCIDCLDRTNVAQFAYGHAALGRQIHALGLADSPQLDLRASVAVHLMHMYEAMGNVLACQVSAVRHLDNLHLHYLMPYRRHLFAQSCLAVLPVVFLYRVSALCLCAGLLL